MSFVHLFEANNKKLTILKQKPEETQRKNGSSNKTGEFAHTDGTGSIQNENANPLITQQNSQVSKGYSVWNKNGLLGYIRC